jgi:hypothetical protein
MGKEVMGRSLECGSLDAAMTLERNAIQWLVYAPDIQAMMDGFRKAPETLTETQKASNRAAEGR